MSKEVKEIIDNELGEIIDEGSNENEELLKSEGENPVEGSEEETDEKASEKEVKSKDDVTELINKVVNKTTKRHKKVVEEIEQNLGDVKAENDDLKVKLSKLEDLENKIAEIETNANKKMVGSKIKEMQTAGVPVDIIKDFSELPIDTFLELDYSKYAKKPVEIVKKEKEHVDVEGDDEMKGLFDNLLKKKR